MMNSITLFSLILSLVAFGTSISSFSPGIFPDPEDCKSYYLCGEGPDSCQKYTCEEDLLFDAELLVCNYHETVDCGDRPNPYAPSTSPGPTDVTTKVKPETTTKKIKTTTKMDP